MTYAHEVKPPPQIDPKTGIVTHRGQPVGKVLRQKVFWAFICPATRWFSRPLYWSAEHAASALIRHLQRDQAADRAKQAVREEPMATFVNVHGRRSEIRSAGRRTIRRRFSPPRDQERGA